VYLTAPDSTEVELQKIIDEGKPKKGIKVKQRKKVVKTTRMRNNCKKADDEGQTLGRMGGETNALEGEIGRGGSSGEENARKEKKETELGRRNPSPVNKGTGGFLVKRGS